MERLTFNAAAAKLIRKDGRDWRVAPMSIITPGVLAGSKGPLLYEPDECRNSVPEWDGTPITLFHPVDAYGTPVSAGHPNAKRIGHLANTRFDGKLRSVGWFDVEATRAADQELGTNVLWSLENGRSVELSTGLYTDNFPSKGVHKGRPYDYVARNYRADHLAVLPGMTGACSIGDGCGVLVNAKDAKGHGSDKRLGAGSTRFVPAHERQQNMAKEAFAKGKEVEGMSLRVLTKKQFEHLKDKHDLTDSEAFGSGFAGEGDHEVFKTDSGIVAVRRKTTENKKEEGCGDGG